MMFLHQIQLLQLDWWQDGWLHSRPELRRQLCDLFFVMEVNSFLCWCKLLGKDWNTSGINLGRQCASRIQMKWLTRCYSLSVFWVCYFFYFVLGRRVAMEERRGEVHKITFKPITYLQLCSLKRFYNFKSTHFVLVLLSIAIYFSIRYHFARGRQNDESLFRV